MEGWRHSLSLGIPIGQRWNVELEGGVRDEANLTNPQLGSTLSWYGLNIDVSLGRHLFAGVSAESSSGGSGANDQIYASITYRF